MLCESLKFPRFVLFCSVLTSLIRMIIYNVTVCVIYQKDAITADIRHDRVVVWYDDKNKVSRVPKIG